MAPFGPCVACRPVLLVGKAWVLGLACLLVCFLESSFSAEVRNSHLQSAEELAYARKSVLSQLAPLLPDVLQEAGMPADRATAFCERFQNQAMVNTQHGQIDFDSARAAEILAALPEGVRQKFLALTYQWTGPSSLWRDEVADVLVLKPEQQHRVGEIMVGFLVRVAPANRPDFSYGMTPGQFAAYARRTAEIEAGRDRELLALLTSGQRKSWDDLIGPPSAALRKFRDYCAAHNPQ